MDRKFERIVMDFVSFFLIITSVFSTVESCGQAGEIDHSFNPLDRGFGFGDGFNYEVYSQLIQNDGKIIMGGRFTSYNGIISNCINRLNPDGTPDLAFNVGDGANNIVLSITEQNDGKIILGGLFTSFNGSTKKHIARINSDGTPDTSFNGGTGSNGWIYKTAIQNDGKIIISGNFTYFEGVFNNDIARLNYDGTLDSAFSSGTGTNGTITTVAIQIDGKIIIGGFFNTYNGVAIDNIARLNSDGTLDTSFLQGSGANGQISSISLQDDGKIIICGSFHSYNGVSRNNIARLNSDGTLDTSFAIGSGLNGFVKNASVQNDGKILICGGFTSYNGTAINRIARLYSDGVLDSLFEVGIGANNRIDNATQIDGGKIIISGFLTSFNGIAIGKFCRLNSNGSLDNTFAVNTEANNTIRSLSIQSDGKIIIGGNFTAYNGTSINSIARLFNDGKLDTMFTTGTGPNSWLNTTSLQSDGKIIIGGNFTTYNGIAMQRIARLNSDGTLDTLFMTGTGANNVVRSSAIQSDGKIIIGGNFTAYNGIAINRFLRLATDGTIDTSFTVGTGPNAAVHTASIQNDGKIIIGGEFTSYNGTAINHIARINTNGTMDTSFTVGIGANDNVRSISVQPDGKIIISGSFSYFNGVARNRIVRLNNNGTIDTTFIIGSGANGTVITTYIMSNGKIIIGGNFNSFNGTIRNHLAQLNPNGSLDTMFSGFNNLNDLARTISVQSDGKIIIGGDFTSCNGITRNRFVRLNTDGTTDNLFSVVAGANNLIRSTSIQNDGKIIIAGNFTSYNNTSISHLARINADGNFDVSFAIDGGADNQTLSTAIQNDGKILIGGSFTSVVGSPINRIARLESNGKLDTLFEVGSGANSYINAIAIQGDGKIIIGGYFNSYNGINRKHILRLNTDGHLDTLFYSLAGINETLGPNIQTISIQNDGKIIIGGWFNSCNNMPRNNISRLNIDGTLDSTFNIGTGANNYVYASSIQRDGKLIIVGEFTTYNGTAINRIARLNSNGSLDSTFSIGSGVNATVYAITIQSNGKIIIGGEFTSFNGVPSNRIACLNVDGSLDTSFSVGMGANDIIRTTSIQSDGKIIIGGNFTSYNGTGHNKIARIYGSCNISHVSINESECGSYLSPSGNHTWTTSGIYSDTLTNIDGCDSILTINLTIQQPPLVTIMAQGPTSFCEGDSVLLTASSFLNAWQWYHNNIILPGETSMNYIAKQKGQFYCIGTDSLLCADTSNNIDISIPCIPPIDPSEERFEQNNINNQIKITPNPGTSIFNIKSPGGMLLIVDGFGQEIYRTNVTKGDFKIELYGVKPGIYSVILRKDSEVLRSKLILVSN